ncbi:MAG: hypothetical protein ACPH3N_15380, partial [Alcanivorax sediminis]|uniref:hypothetical protein n=1 Tax=Alcanivorax sediminis TaxID=2663008 RepID=UPI003C6B2E43
HRHGAVCRCSSGASTINYWPETALLSVIPAALGCRFLFEADAEPSEKPFCSVINHALLTIN